MNYYIRLFIRLLKVLISIVYIIFATVKNSIFRVFKGYAPSTFITLLYHAVYPEQKDTFIKHIQFAKKVGIPVFPDIDKPVIPGSHHIALVFDDAFENFSKNALPILQDHNVVSTVFVPTDFIGSNPGWIKDVSRREFNEKLMSASQLADLPSDTVMIGSHGKSHTPLSKLDNETIKIELEESKRVLEGLLGREIRLLALPHGSFCPNIAKISRKAGYDRVFTCVPVSTSTNFNDVFAGRIDITLNDWPIEYKLKYLGGYQWQRYVFKLNHSLDPAGHAYYIFLFCVYKLYNQVSWGN